MGSDERREFSAAVAAGCLLIGLVLVTVAAVFKCIGLPLG